MPVLVSALGARANHDEPFGGEPGGRDKIKRGQRLSLELDGSGRLFDQRLSLLADEVKRRRAEDEILAHENDQGPRIPIFPAGLSAGCPGSRL